MRDTQPPQGKQVREEGHAEPAPSMKFPRTPHLAGPGRPATPDDVILSASETEALLQGGHRIVLEEKVDGANIGLSLDTASGRICVQNRSHVADIEGSAQFSKMKGWLEQKKPEILAVLSRGYVLYGEWLQARHTVAYDALPDWFVAFDLFSLADAKFLSTRARDALLAEHAPSIARIREVRQEGGGAATRQALLALLRRTPSAYRLGGGTPEGLYLRVEQGGFLHMRAKLVDPEFKQAIDETGHWMHRAREANKVRADLWEAPEALDDAAAPSQGLAHEPEEADAQNEAAERVLEEAQARGRGGDYPSALDLSGRALCMARAIVTQHPAANARRARGMLRAHSLEAQALFGLGRYEAARDSFSACAAMLGDADCGDEALCAGLRSKCERGLAECERLLEEGGVRTRLNNPRERVLVKTATGDVLLMRNTSWLVPNQILSGSTPKNKEHVTALSEACGVTLVVTLTEEEPLKREWFSRATRNLFFPVPNYCPPSMEQMKAILRCMEDEILAGGRVFVHCGGGKGRAGTVNACWMVRHGLEAYAGGAGEGAPSMCGEEAVRVLRDLRPGSIETDRQERFVSEWCAEAWRLFDAPAHAAPHEKPAAPSGAAPQPTASPPAQLDGAEGWHIEGARPSAPPHAVPSYPRTPHLDFSPEVASDDLALPAHHAQRFVRSRVVVTEKLDGGNCCVFDGRVYARTHAHEARAAWFSAAKAKAAELKAFSLVPAHVALFVENMQAIHSIDYGCLSCPMYVISALDVVNGKVLSWEETEDLAESAGLPTVPVLYDGEFESREHLQSWMRAEIVKGSCVGGGAADKEGFVVRFRDSFHLEAFADSCAKYVRRGHVQTDANFRLTWKQAVWSNATSQCAAADAEALDAASDASPRAAGRFESEDAQDVSKGETKEVAHSEGLGESSSKKGKKGSHAKMCCPAGPKFVMLVGLPGSGKSTFWNLLKEGMKDGPEVYVRVSQDELGSRGVCEDAVGSVLGGRGTGQGVVLDRCNCAAADRATWLALAMQSPKQCACVFFDFDQETCTKRVAARTDHPTIPFGRGGRAVASHAKLLEAPTVKEGFSKVYRVACEEDARRVASHILSRS